MSRMGPLLRYFLRLGTLGFGGPIALVGAMQRDLVERRAEVDREEFLEGLALAQLAPGPLAAQLAMWVGWRRGGAIGALAVGVAFVLPSFLLVLALSGAYVRFGGLPWMAGAFYGLGAACLAVIGRGAYSLARMTLGRDRLLWVLFFVSAGVTALAGREIPWLFLGAGVTAVLARLARERGLPVAALALPPGLLAGVHGPADPGVLVTLAAYFAEAGAFVFGSGLAIVPFLHAGVVERFGWLTERQFLDAVAVAMITPGPVVITVAFIGYLVAGPAGALVAAVATFLPCWFFTVVPAPHVRRLTRNAGVRAFVSGVTAAASGAIAGAAVLLARRAVLDGTTAGIAIAALFVLARFRRVPEPVVLLLAGLAGWALAPGS